MWKLPQITALRTNSKFVGTHTFKKFFLIFLSQTHIIHNYIIKYLIFCMEPAFCDKINGTQFYRDQYKNL
ncbi:hypothetical protein LIH_00315 [Leptospira interrogans serovar Hardjo-prajitno]|nr:hypothetical protein LIH_00315 [Leptospira interrogans serovar Hardjo-prajitno]KGE28562.1 hypothetical protein IQ65_00350 [Leptospira interrogans serovar Lai]QIP62425.1 hypothetical protein LICSK_00305 [Leptospira interrogans serovar Copenhageni]